MIQTSKPHCGDIIRLADAPLRDFLQKVLYLILVAQHIVGQAG